MKHTLFTLLAALVASPAFAGNLNPDDWAPMCDHQDCKFTFENNGNLIAHGGEYGSLDGCMLLYTSTAPKMENNSSLAITLQFAATPDAITTIPWSSFTIIPQGSAPLNVLQVMKSNAGSIILKDINLTDGSSKTDYTLSEGGETTAALTLNYTVENGNLCYTYTFNGKTSKKMTAAEGIDTSLAWQPVLAWDWNNPTAFTVTDVTFSTSSPMVPEPATATLSLLALCGLAARRRRK